MTARKLTDQIITITETITLYTTENLNTKEVGVKMKNPN